MARGAASPKPFGRTMAARTLPRRTASTASLAARSRTSSAASPRSAASICFEIALASWSASAIGMREVLPPPEPNSEPKNAAMTIGAAIDMTSARRFEK